jgi:hypothetical protein
MTPHPRLRVVSEETQSAADMLRELVPEMIRAEETAAALRALVESWRRQLARERGVAFVREEHVRREFGEGNTNA